MIKRIPYVAYEMPDEKQCPNQFAYHDTSNSLICCRWVAGHDGPCETTIGHNEWIHDEDMQERVRRIQARWAEEEKLENKT